MYEQIDRQNTWSYDKTEKKALEMMTDRKKNNK